MNEDLTLESTVFMTALLFKVNLEHCPDTMWECGGPKACCSLEVKVLIMRKLNEYYGVNL